MAAIAAAAPLPCNPKTCIYFGWDTLNLTSKDVYRCRDKFAATGFDGIAVNVEGKAADGKGFLARQVMASHPFTRGEFDEAAPMLREILATKGLRESLFMVYWMGTKERRIGWVDDAAWAEFAANMRFVCAFAKEMGFKGLFIDHEDYTDMPLFWWRPSDDPPYAETVALARRRGAETARAMAAGDPDVRFVFDRTLMQIKDAVRSQTPVESSAAQGALWYPFFNGFLEAMGPGMRHVEGCEEAYGAKTSVDYRALIGDCRSVALEVIEPQLRTKYLGQTEMSFGKYLDGWQRNPYYEMHTTIPATLFEAGVNCDRMFWVYGEKGSVVDWGAECRQRAHATTWSEAFPGLPSILRLAVGDYSELRAKAASGALTNLVTDIGAKGPGRLEGPVAKRGFRAVLGFKAGDRVYAAFSAKGDDVAGTVLWADGRGVRMCAKGCQVLARPSMALADGWNRYECVLIVPDGVDGVGVELSARNAPQATTWFSDISIYKW